MQHVSISLAKSSAQSKPSFITVVLALLWVALTHVFCKTTSGLRVLRFWYERRATRLHLARLEDWQLKDVGLTREQAQQEAAKSFWQS